MNAGARDQVTTLLRRARETPDAIWLTQPIEGHEITFSWSRAANEIARVAAALRALELPSGSRIGITGKNTAHWMLADLAVAMAGHVSVGIYPKQAIATTRYIFEHSDVRAVFLGPPIAGDRIDVREAVPTGVPTISLPYPEAPLGDHRWDDLVAANEPLSDYVARGPDELYWLVYTSGTTGNPKGVMLTVANMLFAIENYRTLLPLGDRPRFFSYLPLAHRFERAAVEAMSLEVGGHVYFLESQALLDAQLRRASPDFFIGVPLVYGRLKTAILRAIPERILDLAFRIPSLRAALRRRIISKLGLRNAKLCITGGASTPVPTLRFFESLDLPLHQAYGMSESGAYGTIEIPGARRVGSVGRPAPGATLKIGADGEILLRHGAVMSGYFREPELTTDAFTADGYLRTGDKGDIDDDGYLFVTGSRTCSRRRRASTSRPHRSKARSRVARRSIRSASSERTCRSRS